LNYHRLVRVSCHVRQVELREVPILISQPLPFVTTFIDAINAAIQEHRPGSRGLSRTQRWWLGICLMGIMVTNSVCWARFERATLGCYSLAALAWMFRHAKVPWELLLQMSVQVLLKRYGITAGVLVVDDSDKRRAKVSRRLAHVHKLKDKTSGGFVMGPVPGVSAVGHSHCDPPCGLCVLLPGSGPERLGQAEPSVEAAGSTQAPAATAATSPAGLSQQSRTGFNGVPPVPWTVYGLGLKPCIAVVAGSVLDISSSRS
jgi:hypothetical protein